MAIAHLTLATRDVRRASAFFAAALGWHPVGRPANSPLPTAWLRVAPGQELHLVEVAGYTPSPFEGEFGRHVAVSHPAAGFTDLKRRLRQLGAELLAPQRETPFERFFFRDLDGNVFEVVPADSTRRDDGS